MKPNSFFYSILLSILVLLFLISCKEDTVRSVPIITVAAVTNFTSNSATCVGEITSDGGSDITGRGFCWAKSQYPTISNDKTNDGSGIGSFTRVIDGLTPGTTYNIRAYAINSEGDNYSSQSTFTTLALTPVLTTSAISSINSTTIICGGNIITDGGSMVTVRGVCWSTSQNPTVADNKTIDGMDSGIFTSSITGLIPGITYYIKAYATNNIGTGYGNLITTKTPAVVPMLTTNIVTDIAENTAKSGGNIMDQGGAAINSHGVCWSTSHNPTINDNQISEVGGSGSFTCNLSDLTPNTTFYLRAFATNIAGTGYGNEISFKSKEPGIGTVTDIDGNVYHTITIGTQVWMKENLKTTRYNDGTSIPHITDNSVWGNLISPGYCWYKNEIVNKNIYGALYNWYTVNTGNLCPKGWHVPTDAEWTTLTNILGGESIAGGKLKESGTTHWSLSSNESTNETGFTALPGGIRSNNGNCYNLGDIGYWWSSTDDGTASAWFRFIYQYRSNLFPSSTNKENGFSVRCLQD